MSGNKPLILNEVPAEAISKLLPVVGTYYLYVQNGHLYLKSNVSATRQDISDLGPFRANDSVVYALASQEIRNKTINGSFNTISNVNLVNQVTGVLPIARGGTNSSISLVNNRFMVSNNGAIRETSELADGQLFVGVSGSVPTPTYMGGGPGISVSSSAANINVSATNYVLIEQITLKDSVNVVQFTVSEEGPYNHLKVIVSGQQTESTTEIGYSIVVTLNEISDPVYDYINIYENNMSAITTRSENLVDGWTIGRLPTSEILTPGICILEFPFYKNTNWNKTMCVTNGFISPNSDDRLTYGVFTNRSTDRIAKITFTLPTPKFKVGTMFYLYGYI